MEHLGPVRSEYGLENHGIVNAKRVYWNLSRSVLLEEAVRRGEGHVSAAGAIVIETGKYTGRSPSDKFIVKESFSGDRIDWGKVNREFDTRKFDLLHARLSAYMQGKELYVQDCRGGAAKEHALDLRVVSTSAVHSLFARTMFLRPTKEERAAHVPQFTILHAPEFKADPTIDGTNSECFVVVNYERKLCLIGGTAYAGEIKKAAFSVLNYLLPLKNVFPMHASVNVGTAGDSAVFFGLSGTGKTTLSADPERELIGDDEHGWADDCVFNFEGGCYAKTIRLSQEAEPDIWQAVHSYATILENVVMDEWTRELDLDSAALTENTRAAYMLGRIRNASVSGVAKGHPKNVIMLTADAYGVLPPIARLTPAQAMYHFISGYTAKVAGTERGITEPQATFSACFGGPFLPMHPTVYAKMLGEKLEASGAAVWLVNTGWTGGPYGVGKRMSIAHTRAMISAALSGQLTDTPTTPDPVFGVGVPKEVPGVPTEVLTPRNTWEDKAAYDAKAKHLAGLFVANFAKFADQATDEVKAAAPKG
ncbi:MAG: phosphoenolpyruvate carboxykinase (ATP) [Polyangiaceae bacterium]|nr:phosphoenolpyruvate carboxykinase (ATP) [Polyangiaceae bacterium]MCW5792392.1 phosphoenolpyruvate carboxykinase (ATP) [Polyangiaceae bacterium]